MPRGRNFDRGRGRSAETSPYLQRPAASGRRATKRFVKEKQSSSILWRNRDLLSDTTDRFSNSLLELNPDLDFDVVKTGVERLFGDLARGGGGDYSGGSSTQQSQQSQPSQQVAASAKPEYNLAGDILVMAHKNFQKKNYKEAFRMFATAMASEDSDDLMGGISNMNNQTEFGRQADQQERQAQQEGEEEEVPELRRADTKLEREIEQVAAEFADEEGDEEISEEEEFDPEDEEEYEGEYEPEEEEEYSEDEEEEYDPALAELEEPEAEDDPGDLSEDDDIPMGGTSSNNRAAREAARPESTQPSGLSEQARMRALANKLSLTGTEADRRNASKVLRIKKKAKARK